MGYFTNTGTLTYSTPIYTLLADATLPNNICDPKVIYDNVAKRFIFYAQVCDQVAANSKVFVAFSKSQNPAAGWYINQISGNPYNDGSFFDYPKMAVSSDEVFITGNLFKATSGNFNKAVVYQIPKAPGYAGTVITTATKYAIPSGAFTLLPAGKGMNGAFGPGIFLVSTAGSTNGSNLIRLHRITNNAASSPVFNTYSVTTTSYSAPGNATQQGSTYPLNTGDCRALDGFYLKGIIHFVHNVDDGSGFSSIEYNRLNVNTMINQSSRFGVPGTDIAYPAIAAATNDTNNKSVVIACNQTSSAMYPRTCVVGCDTGMLWSSLIQVKAGINFVHYSWSTSTSDRWGDYTGMAKKYNDSAGACWMAGMYGNASNTWTQYIAKIKPTTVGIALTEKEEIPAQVFPNPIVDNYHVKFQLNERQKIVINITDMQGRTVVELYNDMAEKGENLFSFNKANLTPGVYSLNIIGTSTNIKNEKIVVADK